METPKADGCVLFLQLPYNRHVTAVIIVAASLVFTSSLVISLFNVSMENDQQFA